MKGLWVPVAGGVGIPLVLFTLSMLIGDALEHRWGLPWLANALKFSVVAPMALWERVFPPLPTGPTDKAIVATIVTVFLFYAVATYLVQMAVVRVRA